MLNVASWEKWYYIIPVYWWWKSRDLIGLDIELARLKRVIMHCWYDNALLARVQILFVYERWVVVRRDTDSELFELSEEDFLSMRQYFMRNYEGNFESNPVIAYLFKSSPTTCTKVKALGMHEIGPSLGELSCPVIKMKQVKEVTLADLPLI